MISKNRKNKISNRRNKISKKRKISGGGEIFSWNLGPIILKKEKGYISDTYWIEYPTDPIQNGWTQIAPTNDDVVPTYKCSEPIVKEGYQWKWEKIRNFHRPLPDGSFETKKSDDNINKNYNFNDIIHHNKLSEQTWKKSMEILQTKIKGKKNFIRNFHIEQYIPNSTIHTTWVIKSSMENLYNILKRCVFNNKNRPIEFNDLYDDIIGNYWMYGFINEKLTKKIEKLEKQKEELEKLEKQKKEVEKK